MSLEEKFPAGLSEVPLLYLSPVDLLLREIIDPEFKQMLSTSNLWSRKIFEDYGIKSPIGSSAKTLRQEYYNLSAREIIQNGFVFELGQNCLLFFPEESLVLAEDEIEYATGFLDAKCEGKLPFLVTPTKNRDINIYLALQHGDEDAFRKFSRGRSLSSGKFSPFSKEIIDSLIRFEIDTPALILRYLTSKKAIHPKFRTKDLFLVEYLLNRYLNELDSEDLSFAIKSLDIFYDMVSVVQTRRPDEGIIIHEFQDKITAQNIKEAQELLRSALERISTR